jgi:NADH dehydrogenase
MTTRSVATVFGGSGFIGRYVVKRLAAQGYVVRIAVRDTVAAQALRPMGRVAQIVPLYAPVTQEGPIERAVEGADVVINLVGILAEYRSGDFQRIHAEGAGLIARASAAAGVGRLVHVSAIGADPASPSAYGKTKAQGEAAVRDAFPGATILRPSIVFGAEDRFFNRIGRMAQLLPFMPVIYGDTKMQPVYVGDVADAVMAVIDRPDAVETAYELGGPKIFTFRDLLVWLLKETQRHRRLVDIPPALVRLQAALGEMLPSKPLTRDQLLMLQRDNIASPGMPGLDELGIVPTPIDLIVPSYLDQYRPGGGRREPVGFHAGEVPKRT